MHICRVFLNKRPSGDQHSNILYSTSVNVGEMIHENAAEAITRVDFGICLYSGSNDGHTS